MNSKQQLITYFYHFLIEALMIFLLISPFFYFQANFVPYWEYLVIALCLSGLFTLYIRYTSSYVVYLVTALGLGLLFLLLNYPLFIIGVLIFVLTWRSISLRKQLADSLNKANLYLIWLFFIGFILFIYMKQSFIILYIFIQLFVLFAGFISSHLFVIEKEERQQVDRNLPLYILGLIGLGTLLIIPLFSVGRIVIKFAWLVITSVFIFFAVGVVWLFEMLNVNITHNSDTNEVLQMDAEPDELEQEVAYLIDDLGPYLYWGVIAVLGMIVLLIILRTINKKFKQETVQLTEDVTTYTKIPSNDYQKRGLFQRMYDSVFKRSRHPVRRILWQFEQEMVDTNYERYTFETIDQWTKRIGLEANVTVYQKVRYGNIAVNKQEVEEFKQELAHFKKQLKTN